MVIAIVAVLAVVVSSDVLELVLARRAGSPRRRTPSIVIGR